MKYVRSVFLFLLFTAINGGIVYYKFKGISMPSIDNLLIVYCIYTAVGFFAYSLVVLIFSFAILTKDKSKETKEKFNELSTKMQKEYKYFKFTNNYLFKAVAFLATIAFAFYGLWFLFVLRLINHVLHAIYQIQMKSIVENK